MSTTGNDAVLRAQLWDIFKMLGAMGWHRNSADKPELWRYTAGKTGVWIDFDSNHNFFKVAWPHWWPGLRRGSENPTRYSATELHAYLTKLLTGATSAGYSAGVLGEGVQLYQAQMVNREYVDATGRIQTLLVCMGLAGAWPQHVSDLARLLAQTPPADVLDNLITGEIAPELLLGIYCPVVPGR